MDILLKKKHPVVKYKYYIAFGLLFLIFLIYVILSSLGPRKIRYDSEKLMITEVKQDKFLEYISTEGIVQPILTIKLNTLESGTVQKIVAESGAILNKGDTIMILNNPDLKRTIEDEHDHLEKQRVQYREKSLGMQKSSSQLKRQTLETIHRFNLRKKQYTLSQEEFRIGIKSKAELEIEEEEYLLNQKNTELLLAELRHDSTLNVIQNDLMKNDLKREEKSYLRSLERLNNLIVRAPIAGQLSSINVIQGERVAPGNDIGQLKVIDDFKILTKITEYYIDRIMAGLPATIIYQEMKYPLKITRVSPEIADRQFAVDLVFTGDRPESLRVGKSFNIQIELGQPEDAMVINKGHFFQSTGGQWIFKVVDNGSRAVKVPITIGRQNPRQFEVLSGLEAGDQVIITGYDHFGNADEVILK